MMVVIRTYSNAQFYVSIYNIYLRSGHGNLIEPGSSQPSQTQEKENRKMMTTTMRKIMTGIDSLENLKERKKKKTQQINVPKDLVFGGKVTRFIANTTFTKEESNSS